MSVTQNIRRFIERPLRAAQRVPGSRMRPSEPRLRTTGLHQSDRHSQPSRRGCHSRELLDQPFTFCIRFGTASISSTVFMHSIGVVLRETELKWKSVPKKRGTTLQTHESVRKPKAVFSASERQYTAAGGDVQVPRVGIYVWQKARRLIHGLSSAWALSLCGHKTGAFKRRKAVSFQIDLCSDPYLWSCILGNDRKNINPGASTKDRIFEKSPRCDNGAYRDRLRPVQETSLASPCLNLSYFWIKCSALKKKLATFRQRSVIRRPGHCAPLVTSLVWYFAINCAAVKFALSWMSNHF